MPREFSPQWDEFLQRSRPSNRHASARIVIRPRCAMIQVTRKRISSSYSASHLPGIVAHHLIIPRMLPRRHHSM